ncbi:MAG: hypothetical protein FJ384_03630 [Verrucomicrobia bacterium]|nr:hypothetical protein [Verrucomicrobiota bacterium]
MDPRFLALGLACVDVAMAAVSWLILLCTYPDFARWRAEGFAHHHVEYTRKVGRVVGPLLLLQLAGHVWLVCEAGQGWPALAMVLACWGLTGFWSVPCHRRLQVEGPASPALVSLIRSHAWRTALWSLLAMESIRRAAG